MNKVMQKHFGRIFVMSGPSGSGKTTLHQKLLLDKKIKKRLVKTISATTRKKRAGERHGQHYLFLTEKQFLNNIKKGYFLEWQKVFTDYYGTPKAQAEKILKTGKNILLCIDVKGAKIVFKAFKDAVGLFIKAPSLSILKKRLQKRGTESAQALARRLDIARREMKEAKHYRYLVVNTDVKKAVQKLKRIVIEELKAG
ncbi:MAG: guanylate kinase [Candidatus Omnitrophota bacterium]